MQYCMRLTHGMDLLDSIRHFVQEERIRAGVVLACVGCVYRWRVRAADGESLFEASERAEIVSLTGTVSENGCHLHISLARGNIYVIGGHLVEGCIINTTAEIVIESLEGMVFDRVYDENTGYKELVIMHVDGEDEEMIDEE